MSDYLEEDLEIEDNEGEPSLGQVLDRAMRSHAKDLRVCLPAIVTAVDGEKVNVRPLIKEVGNDASDPVISDVRICYPGSGAVRFDFKVVAGDLMLLVFADRSLDEWEGAGGLTEVQAKDPRVHDITDAFAIPISFSSSKSILTLLTDLCDVFTSATSMIVPFTAVDSVSGTVVFTPTVNVTSTMHTSLSSAISSLKSTIDALKVGA